MIVKEPVEGLAACHGGGALHPQVKEPYHSHSHVEYCSFLPYFVCVSAFWSMTMVRSAVVVRARIQPCEVCPAILACDYCFILLFGDESGHGCSHRAGTRPCDAMHGVQ